MLPTDPLFTLVEQGYPPAILRKYLSAVKTADRKTAPEQRNISANKKLLPFVTQYHLAFPGGALGYFLGGYVPSGTPNWHPVLKKNSPKIDTPF